MDFATEVLAQDFKASKKSKCNISGFMIILITFCELIWNSVLIKRGTVISSNP